MDCFPIERQYVRILLYKMSSKARIYDKFFSSVLIPGSIIVAYFQWKATNDQFFPKMDVLTFSVKLSIGNLVLAGRLLGVFSIVYDPVPVCTLGLLLATDSSHIFSRKIDSRLSWLNLGVNTDRTRKNSPNYKWQVSMIVLTRHRLSVNSV